LYLFKQEERRKERLNKKILAVLACTVMAVMMVVPIVPVNAGNGPSPRLLFIKYREFPSQDSLFTALLTADSAGGVDVMGWPLTKAEYQTAISNTSIIAEPLPEAGEFEIAFNNNLTDGIQMDRRSPMNFTDFRNAINCLIDKNGVIAGPTLSGFAARDDTQIPQPLMNANVNPAVSYPNYPWEFNVTHALEILYRGGWFNHAIYTSFSDLLTAYGNGSLSTAGGTVNGVVYSGNDTYGQWGGGDPQATANTAIANTPIAALVGYVLTTDARKDLGDLFCAELKAIGCPFNEIYEATLAALRPHAFTAQAYDFATLSYTFAAPPMWFYSELTPVGIYPNGPNCYLVDDANMTHYATAMYEDSNQSQYQVDLNMVQQILVMESELVSIYSPVTFCAYKTGLLGMFDVLGYGTLGNWNLMNWITANVRKTNTINYTGPPENTPDSNILYYGQFNPPELVNPIFSSSLSDFQILGRIFACPMTSNPYKDFVPGSAITDVPTGGDMPWMAYWWQSQLIPAQDGSGGQWTNVTYWFRNDTNWSDGVPFTVADLNCTIYENALYGDSYANSAFRMCTNASDNYKPYFTAWDNWTCSILVTNPSWLSLYIPNYLIIPEHIYKYIVPNNLTQAIKGLSTDGLHGYWPGQTAVAGNVLPGAPFNQTYLNQYSNTTLVGSNSILPPSLQQQALENIIAFLRDADPSCGMGEIDGMIYPGKYYPRNHEYSAGMTSKVGLPDLVMLANAYGTTGTPISVVSINSVPGAPHTWNPACDIAAPSGVIGLSDLVVLAMHYGWYYANYSYNAPYPPAETANGGP
jgi:hypothetical protein